jgi:hypothetical protein
MTDEEVLEDAPPTPPPTTPRKPKGGKPEPVKRSRRGNLKAQTALSVVRVHLNGVYSQMNLLKAAMDELTEALK